MSTSQIRKRRLWVRGWRRGTKEMDLLLGGFVDRLLQEDDEAGCQALEPLLELADPLIFDMVYGYMDPGEHREVVGRIRAHHGLDPEGRMSE